MGSPGGGAAVLAAHDVVGPAVSVARRDHTPPHALRLDRRPLKTALRI
jgi:hypothetical protein